MVLRVVAVIGLGCVVLAGCNNPDPKSADYYAANETEAREVLAKCEADTLRGVECDNARAGVMIAQANNALDYKPKKP